MLPPEVFFVTACLSLVLQAGNGYAGSQPCRIAFPMTTQYISAYYDTIIQGKGCSSNATTNSTAEVHVINLLNAGPVFRNDLAEVNLLIKSRNEERAYLEPFVYVLNSRQPVRWKIRTDITLASKKKHLFVIPSYSTIRLVTGSENKRVRKSMMPQDTQTLMSWVKNEYEIITSYTELKRGNQMTLNVGLDKHAASDCVIQENSSQKLNVMAKFEQPQLSSGCIVPQTDISRVAYIIEVEQVSNIANNTAAIEAHLDIRSMSKKRVQKDFWLVLKSPDHVNWRVSTHKLQGYIDIVANSYVDMMRIRMDPVNVRRDEILATDQGLIRWVEDYLGPVAMYTKINLANKIKLVLPDTGSNSPKANPTHIDPFSVRAYTKNVIKRVLHTECGEKGQIIIHMKKSVMKIFNLSWKQITLLDKGCLGEVYKKELIIATAPEMCKTVINHKGTQTHYSNAIVIHKEEVDTDLYDQPSGMGINEVDEGEEDLGEEGSGVSSIDGTYIDDEDLNQSPDRIEIPIHCTVPRKREEEMVSTTTSKPRNISHWDPSSDIHYSMVLYRSSHYTDPLHTFPLALPANSRVYVKASIEADQSLRVVIQNCWIFHSDDAPIHWLIRDGCIKDANVRHQYGVLRSVTQYERFSFLLSNATPFSYLICQLSTCQNWPKESNKGIPMCVEESKLCDNDSPIAMLKEITLGPLYATDSKTGPEPEDTENYNASSTFIKVPKVHIVNQQPVSETSKDGDSQKTSGQTVVVEGLDSGTVIGIAFAAFIIGVLLVAALWFIHTHTAPIKHAVQSRAVLDGSGESTPMSTAPLQINS